MSERDPVEALLRAGGKRPPVADDATARVREAVHDAWRRDLRHRRRIRLGWALAAAAVIVVGVVIGLRRAPEVAAAGLRVEHAVGSALTEGAVVMPGSRVTTGRNERLALRAPSGHALRVDAGTSLRVLSDRSLALESGGIYVDGVAPRSSITIETPAGTVEDVGTQFEARYEARTLTVRVREGSVAVSAKGGRVTARAGEGIAVDAAGTVTRSVEPPAGTRWLWIEAAAPPIVIEGRPLRDVLRQIARERGIALRFSAPAVEERAGSIALHGSVEGMTLEQATASILATSGLAARWEDDALVVISP